MRPTRFAQRLFWLSSLVLALYAVIHVGEQLSRVFWNASWSSQSPLNVVARVALLWMPLAVQTVYATWRCFTPIENASDAAGGRLGAVVARAAGVVALAFVLAHAADFRGATWWQPLSGAAATDELHATLSSTRFGVPLTAAGYIAGLCAVAAYLGYAAYAALVGFGYARSEGAAKRVARAAAFAAFGWFVLALAAVIKAATGTLLPF